MTKKELIEKLQTVVHSKQISDHDNSEPSNLMEAPKSLKEILEEESRARLYRTIEKDTNHAAKKDLQDSGYVFDEDVWSAYFNSTEPHKERVDIWSSASSDAETVTYDNGASESKTELRFDLIPADEIATIAKVLGQGAAKYGDDNWKGLPTWTHLNHALQHIFAYLANDKSDDHLSHAATRLIFAMWSDKKDK